MVIRENPIQKRRSQGSFVGVHSKIREARELILYQGWMERVFLGPVGSVRE